MGGIGTPRVEAHVGYRMAIIDALKPIVQLFELPCIPLTDLDPIRTYSFGDNGWKNTLTNIAERCLLP